MDSALLFLTPSLSCVYFGLYPSLLSFSKMDTKVIVLRPFFFFKTGISCNEFPSKFCFCWIPHILVHCFHFHSSKLFIIYFLIHSLIHQLFRNVLLSKYWRFSRNLLLISNLISLGTENILYITWIFLRCKICFMAQIMIYIGRYSSCTWKECSLSSRVF